MGGFPPPSPSSNTRGDSLTGSGVGIATGCLVGGGVGRGGGLSLTELYGGGASGIVAGLADGADLLLLAIGGAPSSTSPPSSLMVGEEGAW
jgi:hypothetical protein